MKRIHVFENACCGKSPSEALVAFLSKKFGDDIKLRVFDLGKDRGDLPMPRDLLLRLNVEGARCLPSLVVDDVPVSFGGLPNLLEVVTVIQTGQMPDRSPTRPRMTVVNTNGSGGGCC